MGPGAVQMYMDMEIPCRFTSLAFSIRSRARSRLVAALGCSILERNNLTEIWALNPRDALAQAGDCDQQKRKAQTPVLGVIHEDWAGKSGQVEQHWVVSV